MKRFTAALLLIAMLMPFCAQAEGFAPLPDYFNVTYETHTRLIHDGQAFVSKEYVRTALPAVDAALQAVADAYDAAYSPALTPMHTPRRNSRLDVNIVHSVSGQSLVSFQVLARTTLSRMQQYSPFECHTYDMATGTEVFLTDLFPADSPAWDVMAAAVRDTLSAYFPGQEPHAEALDILCSRDYLMHQTNFMLSPVCLSLIYEARTLYFGRPSLMRVSIPYSAFDGMMTEYGALQTDNSMYRMVALTFDDGPSYENTARVINELRHAGAHSTFFLLGELILEYPDITMREHDEGHSLQSHHFKHIDANTASAAQLLEGAARFNDALSGTVGTLPTMMRPPYGIWRPFVAAGIPLPQIIWDVDTKDWSGKTPTGILNTVKKHTHHGSIILMHDIGGETAEATAKVAQWLREESYLCVTVEELFLHTGRELLPGKSYNNAVPAAKGK